MSKLIIDFQHTDVMQPRPWAIGVDADNDVTSGLGPDDGARLIGFGTQGEQSVSVWPEDARKDPASVVGLVPTFSDGDNMFEWQHVVGELTIIEEV